MTDCDAARARFSALLDGEAGADELESLESHLAACAGCRKEAGRLSFLDRICLENAVERRAARPFATRRWILLAAAAAVLVVAGLAYVVTRPAPPSAPPLPVVHDVKKAPIPVPAPPVKPEVRPLPPSVAPTPVPAPAPEPEKAPPDPPAPLPKPREERPREPEVPPPPAPAPKETRVAVATLLQIRGKVVVVSDGLRMAAEEGNPVLAGEGVETVGPQSGVVLEYADRTRVEISGDTIVRRLDDKPAKVVAVDSGVVSATVSRQPANQPMVLVGPHAEARVLGTVLRFAVAPAATSLEVTEGRVRFTRLAEPQTVEVAAGYFAVAAPGVDLLPRLIPQDPRKRFAGKVDLAKIDAAIKQGVEFLKKQTVGVHQPTKAHIFPYDELVLWTYVHAGVPEADPKFQELLKKMLDRKLEYTYNVALQAMILEAMNRVKHQGRLLQCAQFLADNQCKDGMWSYGEPSMFADATPPPGKGKPVESDPNGPVTSRPKPKVTVKVRVAKQKDGPATGDHSNSQYAALGIRACHEAGIVFAPDLLRKAQKAWRDRQEGDRRSAGWCYGNQDETGCTPFGSMTAGGIGSLALYAFILGEDWRKDAACQRGLEWMTANFTVSENPARPDRKVFYYLYSLERMGLLYGIEQLGPHEWYPAGAKFLLDGQKPDGSWFNEKEKRPLADTCFAILFLRRATTPLVDVASVDRYLKK